MSHGFRVQGSGFKILGLSFGLMVYGACVAPGLKHEDMNISSDMGSYEPSYWANHTQTS